MKVLVLGAGGREHALAWQLARSTSVSHVFVTPGNPGCRSVATCVQPSSATAEGYLQVALELQPDLTIVGPEAPLVDGVVDLFDSKGLLCFGPSASAARLEGSKIFAKEFMRSAGIPTASYAAAYTPADALAALEGFTYPVVLKADGLASGKGVVICEDRPMAERTIGQLFSGALVGSAGSKLVIEEFLQGEEVSFIGITDGVRVLPLEPSQDHKTIFENDQGPNTGGMGAYSDSRILNEKQRATVLQEIMQPVVDGLRRDGTPFRGFLYAGLMITSEGPKVLEFNVRLGDPETQALMMRLDCDFGKLVLSAAEGNLDSDRLAFHPHPAVCVVIAAHGYPGRVRSGDLISGVAEAEAEGAVVFHAGTRSLDQGLVTAGGRVLGVTQMAPTLLEAIKGAYQAADRIQFDGMQIRRDIGNKGLRRW